MTTIASHQDSVQALEMAQAHEDQPEVNEVQTSEVCLGDQAKTLDLQDALGRMEKAQVVAAIRKKNQSVAVRDEAVKLLELVWAQAYAAGKTHGLELAFASAYAPAPVNPFEVK